MKMLMPSPDALTRHLKKDRALQLKWQTQMPTRKIMLRGWHVRPCTVSADEMNEQERWQCLGAHVTCVCKREGGRKREREKTLLTLKGTRWKRRFTIGWQFLKQCI